MHARVLLLCMLVCALLTAALSAVRVCSSVDSFCCVPSRSALLALCFSHPAMSRPAPFPIVIKLLTGKTIGLDVHASDSVASLKKPLQAELGTPPDSEQQRLIFAGQRLEDHRTLASCGIARGSTVHMVLGECEAGRIAKIETNAEREWH